MDRVEMLSLIEHCLKYMEATRLPSPLPANATEYRAWRERASEPRDVDEESEDAWFELDRLAAEEPNLGWELLTQLTARCSEDVDMCAQIAAGPLDTFLHANAEAFSLRIEEELTQNPGFQTAYDRWRGWR
ncbi:MAG TPA: hypothetical protein VK504_30635 [Vicinamibacterales bacterium]|nr:hypothetical protein [Vicinamibacterales bacterium]